MKLLRNTLLIFTTLCAYALCMCGIWYLYLLYNYHEDQSSGAFEQVFQIISYMAIVLAALVLLNIVVSIIHGIVRRKREQVDTLQATIFVFKIILIPFFIVLTAFIIIVGLFGYTFALAGFVAMFPPIVFGSIVSIAVTLLLVSMLAIGYLMIIATSVHSTSDILYACRQLNIHRGLRALYIILQFIPLADVISLPIINHYLNSKKQWLAPSTNQTIISL